MRIAALLVCAASLALAVSPARDVTFLSTSDSHYREPDHKAGCHNDLNRATVEEMNRLAAENTSFPFSPEDVRARTGRIGAGLAGPGLIGALDDFAVYRTGLADVLVRPSP